MVSHLFYYQLALLALIWLFVRLHLSWPRRSATPTTTPVTPIKPKRKRSTEPKAFEGLTHKPHCVLCEQEAGETPPAPPRRPDPMPLTHRRPRTVDTSMHFCPHTACDDRGWLGLNNLRANGHPSGGPWRQLHCNACDGYFPEHHGTIFHGKQAAVELIVRVLACLAEGGEFLAGKGQGLKAYVDDLQLAYKMLRDPNFQMAKETKTILIIALLYILSPIDLIPDAIPLLGLIDDVLVAGYALRHASAELERYRQTVPTP